METVPKKRPVGAGWRGAARWLGVAMAGTMAAGAWAASAPSAASRPVEPVYIMLTIGRFGPPAVYPSPARLAQAVSVAARGGVAERTTVFVDGIGASRLAQTAPAVVELINAKGLPLGYYGETSNGPYPAPELYEKDPEVHYPPKINPFLTDELSWEAGVDACRTRYSHALTSVTLTLDGRLAVDQPSGADLKRPGGIVAVQRVFGRDVSCLPAHAIGVPQFGFAMAGLTDAAVLAGAVPQAAERAFLRGRSSAPALLEDLTPVFWHMNRLVALMTDQTMAMQRARTVEDLRAAAGRLDRSHPRVVWFDLLDDRTTDTAQAALEFFRKEFFPSNPGSGFVDPGRLVDLCECGGPIVTSRQALALADDLLANAQETLPDYLQASGRFFSLAEVFEILAQGLAVYQEREILPDTLRLWPVIGPIGEKSSLELQAPFAVAAPQALAAAAAAFTETSEKNPWRPPASVKLGERHVNTAQFLLAMAWLWRRAASGQTAENAELTVRPLAMTTPCGRLLEQRLKPAHPNPLWHAQLQLWTLKPCRIRPANENGAPGA